MAIVDFVTLLSAVQSLLASLQSSELKGFCFSYGYKSELENLEHTVNIIKAVLLDAESMQVELELSNQSQRWIKELKDVVYDADDFFDEFVTLAKRHQHKLIRGSNVSKRVQNLFSRFKSLAIAHRMSKVAKEIRERLDAVVSNRSQFDIELDSQRIHRLGPGEETSDGAHTAIEVEDDLDRIIDRPLLGPNVQPDEAHLNANNETLSKTPRGKASLKWVFIVLNVVFEVCQAALSQEAGQGKISRPIYLTLSIITSCLCLIMSLVEAYCEGRRSEVVWQKRGGCCWFYHPGEQGRLFGRFSLYFGIICSMVQLIINLIAKFIRKDFLKFDYVPLLLSVGYMLAAFIESQGKTTSVTANCEHHGRRSPTGVCPGCKAEHSV
uniref:Disease resistance N-terminal domain-containing protein n=1 Tax=Opuntia streptacantha TaxID=393608 RepID=A0A7C9DBY4_OPUST